MTLYVQGYLHALGMTRTAQVKRDARIGEAEARRDAGIKVLVILYIITHIACNMYKQTLSTIVEYLYLRLRYNGIDLIGFQYKYLLQNFCISELRENLFGYLVN